MTEITVTIAELAAELAAHLDAGEVIAATVSGVAIDPDHPDKPGLDVRVSSLDHLLQQPSNQGAHQPMSISEAVSSFLSGGGGKSASFKAIGDRIKGTIVSAEERQQIDLDTDLPAVWSDGKPKMQLVITLQTDEHADPDDDGIRNLYVKGSKKPESKSMTAALIAAIKAAGVSNIDVGGTLAMAYIGDGEPTKRGFNPPKQYQAAYKPPALGGDFRLVEEAAVCLSFAAEPGSGLHPARRRGRIFLGPLRSSVTEVISGRLRRVIDQISYHVINRAQRVSAGLIARHRDIGGLELLFQFSQHSRIGDMLGQLLDVILVRRPVFDCLQYADWPRRWRDHFSLDRHRTGSHWGAWLGVLGGHFLGGIQAVHVLGE